MLPWTNLRFGPLSCGRPYLHRPPSCRPPTRESRPDFFFAGRDVPVMRQRPRFPTAISIPDQPHIASTALAHGPATRSNRVYYFEPDAGPWRPFGSTWRRSTFRRQRRAHPHACAAGRPMRATPRREIPEDRPKPFVFLFGVLGNVKCAIFGFAETNLHDIYVSKLNNCEL